MKTVEILFVQGDVICFGEAQLAQVVWVPTVSLCHCPSPAGQGRESTGFEKDRDITQQLLSWAKQILLGEISLIYCQSNQSRVMRNKSPVLKYLLPISSFLPGSTLFGSLPPPGERCRGMGMGNGPCGCAHHTPPQLQCGVPPMGDGSLWTSPHVSPSHGLQLFPNCSSVVLSHLRGFREGLLRQRVPVGSQPPLGIALSRGGALHGLQPGLCCPVDPRGLSWVSPLTLVCLLPFSLASLSAGYILAPLSQLLFSFPIYITLEALKALLMGSALASSLSILEQAGVGSARHGGSFWHLCTEVCHPL